MTNLHVTWIAPEIGCLPPLAFIKELGGLSRIPGVKLTPVTGRITRDDVSTALRQPADVVIWSGHGEPGGLCVSSAYEPGGVELIRPKWLALQATVRIPPRVIVLAACASMTTDPYLQSMAQEVSRVGIDAIGFPEKADDLAVVRFNVELVRALVDETPLGVAFEVARDVILDSPTAKGVFLLPGLTNGLRDFKELMAGFNARLEELALTQAEMQREQQAMRKAQDDTQYGVDLISKALGELRLALGLNGTGKSPAVRRSSSRKAGTAQEG